MNERIKELAEQAGFFVLSDDKIYIPTTSEEITDCQIKFAESIVQECLGIVSDVGSRKWIGFKGTDTDHCLFRIRQHFGVK